jgi:hypothetical protein
MSVFKTNVYFNNFNLSLITGISIYNHDFISSPNRVINKAKLARADKSVLTSAEYSDKTITIQGIACGSDKESTEDAFENLKGVVQIPEGTLRMTQAGLQVEYIGTLQGITHEYFGSKLKFVLTFICSNPIGRNRLITTLIDTSTTDADHTFGITVAGSFKAQPNIKLSYTAIVGGSPSKNIKVLNADSGQGISLTGSFVTSDIIDIDVDNKTVTQNGVIIDYEGVFPTFFPGSRLLQYIDDFTSRTVAIQVTYNKQFA